MVKEILAVAFFIAAILVFAAARSLERRNKEKKETGE